MLLVLGKNTVKMEKEKTPFHIYLIKIHIISILEVDFYNFYNLRT